MVELLHHVVVHLACRGGTRRSEAGQDRAAMRYSLSGGRGNGVYDVNTSIKITGDEVYESCTVYKRSG